MLLDIKLNGLSGMEGIAQLKRKWPLTPVLMLSSLDEPQITRQALERGAAGFVSKAETAEKIIEPSFRFWAATLPSGLQRTATLLNGA